MATWTKAAFALGLLSLTGCQVQEPETSSEKLTTLISERLGRRLELYSVETESAGTRATCGLAGESAASSPSATAPARSRVFFIYENGELTIADGVVIPADLEARIRRSCPSLTLITARAIP